MLTNWTLRSASLIGHIDEIAVVGGDVLTSDGIPRGGYASFRGWLVDGSGVRQPDGLAIAVGDGKQIAATLGFPRPDVSENLGLDGVQGGFYGVGAVTAACGAQPLVVFARIGDELRPLECSGQCAVLPVVDPLSGLTRRNDGWAAVIDGFFGGDDAITTTGDGGAIVVGEDRPVSLRFWCVDLKAGTPPLAVVARMGGSYLSVLDGVRRADAARHVGAPDAERCGYLVSSVPPLVGVGIIELFAIFEDGTYGSLGSTAFRRSVPLSSRVLPEDAQVTGELDEIRVGDRTFTRDDTIELRQDETLVIRGWSVDTVGPRLTGGVEAHVNDVLVSESRRGISRPDIAAHFEHSGLSDCEFALDIAGANLKPSSSHLTLWGLSARRDARALFAKLRLRVRPATPQT